MASRQSAMVRMRLEDCRTMEERSPRGVGGAERMARKIARVLGSYSALFTSRLRRYLAVSSRIRRFRQMSLS